MKRPKARPLGKIADCQSWPRNVRQPADAAAADAQAAAVELVLVVADAQPAGRAEQLLEPRASHEVALFLRGQHPARFLEQRAALPRRHR